MATQIAPIAKPGMLIREPVSQVFDAFVDPEITARSWFTKGSGWLEARNQVEWDWALFDKQKCPRARFALEGIPHLSDTSFRKSVYHERKGRQYHSPRTHGNS